MCQIIITKDKEIGTAQELITWLIKQNKKEIVMNGSNLNISLDCCLCPFDLDNTLNLNGIKFLSQMGTMEYFVTSEVE